MGNNDQQLQIPSRQLLQLAEHTTETLHHENFGFLSEARGFMPCYEPLINLPDIFSYWDEIARELPTLHSSLGLRAKLDQMPILDASLHYLPDTALLRASHVLSMLSHAYIYVECNRSVILPESLRVPWEIVSRRLGRTESALTYIDLIVYNWRFLNSQEDDPFRVENMALLTPTVNTAEECNFYLTQTEILAQCAPIIGAVVRGQEAMRCHDEKALKHEIQQISECLKRITCTSLVKINPMKSSKHYVDPVVWAKMVAPFAVPMQRGQQGPSGTASPIFGLLDTFLGRKRNDSFLGQEILSLRRTYPCFWREFLEAVGRVPSVLSYVSTTKDTELVDFVNELMRLYAGDDGFLGRHKRKVYGYLELAFKVGRDLTIGGFSGVFKDRAWNTVDAELEQSRRERHDDGSVSGKSPMEAYAHQGKLDHEYPVSELLIHNNDSNGYWLAIDGYVYDITKFMKNHQGGSHTLVGYAVQTLRRVFYVLMPDNQFLVL